MQHTAQAARRARSTPHTQPDARHTPHPRIAPDLPRCASLTARRPPIPPRNRAAQNLRFARSRVAKGQLLPRSDVAAGRHAHGARFWEAVARLMPGRPPADCLDAFLTHRLSGAVARFPAPAAAAPAGRPYI
jgi:hypothetical protein